MLYYVRALVELEKPEHAITIVKALPLYNFMSNHSKPYQKLQVSFRELKWGDSLLLFSKLRMTLELDKGYGKVYFQRHVTFISLQIYSEARK